ncbi:MAG: helix-turn-helix transcriptional regulator [candidate division WOR-3 bacterium]|nr:helix-turn-helix transcriptional regulator [candidate division WOR-3 bacterium]
MKRPKDRFDCNAELGKRLRECRLKAGLTQQKLATAMGRQGKGSHHVAGRLERGEVPNPGVGLLADYLRACRAGFADILSVLDAYTALPTAVEVETRKALVEVRKFLPAKVEKAVQDYDIGVTSRAETRHEPLPELAVRVRRARNSGLSQVWARRVRRKVVSIIETNHLRPGPGNEQHLQNFAAKVWRILNRTKGKREPKRPTLLEAAAKPYMGEDGPNPEHVRVVKEALLVFFREAEIAGALDAEPQLAPGEDQPRGGFQPRPDTRPQREAWEKAREVLVEQLWQEVRQIPELVGVGEQQTGLWRSVVRGLCSVVEHCAPETDECQNQVEAMATDEYFSRRGRDPALVRRLAEVVLPHWEELRQSLGPHPLGRVRPPRAQGA